MVAIFPIAGLQHFLRCATTSSRGFGDDEFVVGGEFSVADIALTSPFVNFAMTGETVDAVRWPGIASYVEHIHSLPCYNSYP